MIEESNLSDFEISLLHEIKSMIRYEKPRPGRVDGAWKGYAYKVVLAPLMS